MSSTTATAKVDKTAKVAKVSKDAAKATAKVAVSKYLSYVLRHHPPDSIDENGYVDVEELLQMINKERAKKGSEIFTFTELEELVDTNNKKRFAFNEEKTKLRASQGHSIKVDLELEPETAEIVPEILYHGTGAQFVNSIKLQGIQKRARQHVHLSSDYATAVSVGSRHGKPEVIMVYALSMHNAGFKFFLSANGVWLTDEVPTRFMTVMKKSS